jgi:hypothetical protein
MYMRGETQASHLENLMREHPLVADYELTLPAVELKRSARKKLQRGDILLLPLDSLELLLHHKGEFIANVSMKYGYDKVSILDVLQKKVPVNKADSKKYETLLCVFGTVRCKELRRGISLNTSTIDMTSLTLFANGKEFAYGCPVWVENNIAIEITKVEK